MSRLTRCCKECGKSYTAVRPTSEFCSSFHRKTWNNRRAVRGAELYDAWMALRYRRGLAKALGLWNIICRMGQRWSEEDKAANAGRGLVSFNDHADELRTRYVRYAATRG